MIGYLLDTHALIWAARESTQLPQAIDALLRDTRNSRYVSAVSAYEIVRKARIGKLDQGLAREFQEQVRRAGYIELPVSMRHAAIAGDFPAEHKDPFDRILAAQALHENLTLLSNDTKLDAFGIKRFW